MPSCLNQLHFELSQRARLKHRQACSCYWETAPTTTLVTTQEKRNVNHAYTEQKHLVTSLDGCHVNRDTKHCPIGGSHAGRVKLLNMVLDLDCIGWPSW